MPKRFLNVEYAGIKTRINVTDMEDLSELQDAILEDYGSVMKGFGAAQLQLYKDSDKKELIEDIDDITFEKTPHFYRKLTEGGSCVFIGTLSM